MMGTIDLRCENDLYGRLTDNRWLEVKCKRRACGYVKGIVVFHTIDITSGQVVRTKKFSDPRNRKERVNGSHRDPDPLRDEGHQAQGSERRHGSRRLSG